MDKDQWYSARCIFLHTRTTGHPTAYEERIILIRAKDSDHAIQRAEDEARDYAASLDGVTYVNYTDVYTLFEKSIDDGCEVYSLIRDSELAPEQYLSHFFDTGTEHSARSGPGEPA